MKDITKKYTNGEVTIVWKPEICIHSGNCSKGLNEVFNPQRRPWVSPDATTSSKIVEQIKKCPSGALSYYMNEDQEKLKDIKETQTIVEVTPNGPLIVHGDIRVKDSSGVLKNRNTPTTLFCRCGASGNKPYCDSSHLKISFKG